MDSLAQKAIDEALQGNWSLAEQLNEQILAEEPTNKEALNRLARTSLELGKLKKAITSYKKVLKIDPYNSIAAKAITRLEALDKSPLKDTKLKQLTQTNGTHKPAMTANLFIEEPGKTKTVSLIHLGDLSVISILDAGEPVKLVPHAHRASVETTSGHYIGRLPDDLSRRIIQFAKSGYEFSTFIRSVAPDCVKVFIKEVKRSPEMLDVPSFPSTEKPGYVSFTSPDVIHQERPDVLTHEEREEKI